MRPSPPAAGFAAGLDDRQVCAANCVRCNGEKSMSSQWKRMGILGLLVLAGAIACQAGPPQATILDACANPRESNRDWCISQQHPNIK